MLKKSLATGLSAILVSALLLGGCSSKPAEPADQPEAGKTTEQQVEDQQTEAIKVSSEKKIIKIAHANGTTWPGHQALEKMKAILDENPNSAITIEILPNGVLGGENEVLQQVMLGTADASLLTGMGFWQGIDERTAVDELPFFFQTKEQARNAYDGTFGDRLKEILDGTGVKTVNFWESGFRNFTNNIRPIVEPADMKGIKFRSYQGEYRMAMFKALGATAVPMALTEVLRHSSRELLTGRKTRFQ